MIKGNRKAGLLASFTVREHTLLSGLSPKIGGSDEGLDPHELLEASLAACTILTCQLYAQRKQWKLESTNVTVSVVSESKEASRIVREISFVGELSEDERARLLDIAGRCPIHLLLQSKVSVETKVV